jgi:hypothetical protein
MARKLHVLPYGELFVVGRYRGTGIIECVGYRCAATKTIKPYLMTTNAMAQAQLAALRESRPVGLAMTTITPLAERTLNELAR